MQREADVSTFSVVENSFDGPIELPGGLGGKITHVVREFARAHGIEHECLYHDEPRWIVWGRDGAISRSVQIAGYRVVYPDPLTDPEDKLFFLPDMHRALDGRTYTVPADVIKRIRLDHHLVLRALMSRTPDEQVGDIRRHLDKAWDKAESYSVQDCTEALA